MRTVTPILLSVLLIIPSAPGWALGEGAGELLAQGERLYEAGEYDGARVALTRVVARGEDPTQIGRALLRLGLIQVLTGEGAAAIPTLVAALAFDPGLKLDGAQHKQQLVEALEGARKKLQGELVVRGPGHEAMVLINNKKAGKAPYIARMEVGEHNVEVRGPGGTWRYSAEVKLPPGRRVKMTVSRAGYSVGDPRMVDWDANVLPRGELSVSCDLAQAQVLLDDKLQGRTPFFKQLSAGVYWLQVSSLDGTLKQERRVMLAPGRREAITIKLAPQVKRPQKASPAPPSLPGPSPRRRIGTWVALGLAGAAGAAALGLGLAADALRGLFVRLR